MAKGSERRIEVDAITRQLPLLRNGSVLHPSTAAFIVRGGDERRIGIPIARCRSPHRLRFRTNDVEIAITLEFPAVAAINEAPVRPRLRDDRRQITHAAIASLAPTEANASGPST